MSEGGWEAWPLGFHRKLPGAGQEIPFKIRVGMAAYGAANKRASSAHTERPTVALGVSEKSQAMSPWPAPSH